MKKSSGYLWVFFLISIFPAKLFAVGSSAFENASFSAASIAQGNAVVAQADEPAAMSYNPAGILQLPGIQYQGNMGLIGVFTHHSGLNGNQDQSGSTPSLVPTAYVTINPGQMLQNRVAFGIGSDSPFGLANKYDSNDPYVHYAGWANWLKMYTLKPTVAVRVTDKILIGGGPMYYRIFDFGGIQAYPNLLLGGAFPDGQIRFNQAGTHWGWQMGVLIKPHKQHQFGFYFRSPVNVRASGLVKVENATVGGNFQTGSDTKINLPLNITTAYAFKPTDRITVETDFGYTRWSTLRKLYIFHTAVGNANDAILNAIGLNDKDFSDGFSLHLGGKYKATDRLTLRGGSFFYWSVIPNDHYIPAVPDGNRLAFTFGPSYNFGKYVTLDFAYLAHLVLRKTINNSISEAIGGSVDGKYFSYIQGFYLTLTCKWEDAFSKQSETETKPEIKEEKTPASEYKYTPPVAKPKPASSYKRRAVQK